MAHHSIPSEKRVQGLEIHSEAFAPGPTAELPHEIGAFQAYKVRLRGSNLQKYVTERPR